MANQIKKSTQPPVSIGKDGIQITDIPSLQAFSQLMLDSGFAPGHKDARSVMGAIAWGWQAGLSPATSLQYVAMINGRPSIWGKGLRALLLASGKLESCKEYVEGEGDKMTAHCELTRVGMKEPFKATFSMDDARKAGLVGKGTWKSYPKRMLEWRAFGFAVANGFSDVTCGMMLAEEAEGIDEPPRSIHAEVSDVNEGVESIEDELPEFECTTPPEAEQEVVEEPDGQPEREQVSEETFDEEDLKRELAKKWASLALKMDQAKRKKILDELGLDQLNLKSSVDELQAGVDMAMGGSI